MHVCHQGLAHQIARAHMSRMARVHQAVPTHRHQWYRLRRHAVWHPQSRNLRPNRSVDRALALDFAQGMNYGDRAQDVFQNLMSTARTTYQCGHARLPRRSSLPWD
jgi:hypothetical protein